MVRYLRKRQMKTWKKAQSVWINQQVKFERYNMCKK